MAVQIAADVVIGQHPPASRARAPVAARIAQSLADCRALLRVTGDHEGLDDLRESSAPSELDQAVLALEPMIVLLTDQLRAQSGRGRALRVLRVREMLTQMYSLRHEAEQEVRSRQGAMLRGIADALLRLRGADSTSQTIARAPVEVCAGCGFDRCVLFRADGATLKLESVYFAQEPGWQEEFGDYARAHAPVLDSRDREIQLLRRRVPILVDDPGTAHGMHDLMVRAWRSTGYVAAPVIVRGSVIGALHADRFFSGARVDTFARDVLATFASGFGYALERTVLLERTRSQLRRMQDMMSEAETSMGQLISAGVSLRTGERGRITAEWRGPSLAPQGDSRLGTLLTRRELEVVELMAQGASNGDIATELVISEGTVKSHVKHILRKLRAANRAQAVCTYMRILALSKVA
jgi:DNA-binding CsgD family transcriptional regulator